MAPSEGVLKIGVKKIAGGVFSGWINDELKAGDVLDVMAPHGSFCWNFEPGARREYVAFAGGSGITPVLSLMKTALAMEPHSRFTLFYGNRNSIGVMFLEEIAGLKDRYIDRLSVFHFLEDEEEEIELFNGRLDRAKAEEISRFLRAARTRRRVLHLRPRPDDGCDRGSARRPQASTSRAS